MSTRKRTTVPWETILERANTMLATPDSSLYIASTATREQAFRIGVTALLESLAHGVAFQYKGYRYQSSEMETPTMLREGYDDTRREYF